MNSKTFIALFFSLLGLTIDLQAQTDTRQQADAKERQKLVAEFRQKGPIPQAEKKSSQVLVNRYNHRETEILSKLNTTEIPGDFPVYKSEYSDEQYTAIINKWYIANPALLKKEPSNQAK